MNNSNIEIDWGKVAAYVLGEMPEEQARDFEQLIQTNPAYKKVVGEVENDLDLLSAISNDKYDANLAWDKVNRRISHPKKNRIKSWSYAAAVLVLATLSIFLLNGVLGAGEDVYLTAGQSVEYFTLPDGSELTLNVGSKATVSKQFGVKNRALTLEGEGFFKVESNPQLPFSITANNSIVTVVGTEFNVNTTLLNTRVLVTEGVVKFGSKLDDTKSVLLEKGFLGTMDHDNLSSVKMEHKNELSWITKTMFFDKSTMAEVKHVLEHTYNIKVELKENFSDSYLLTSTFKEQPLAVVLESIKKALAIDYTSNEEKVVFFVKD